MQQHGEVSDLLRNRVGDDRQRGRRPNVKSAMKGRGDDDAVAEVVHAVADQDHQSRSGRRRIRGCGRLPWRRRRPPATRPRVAVAPQHQLFEEEESQQPCKERQHHALHGTVLEGMREELEETPRRATRPTAKLTSREISANEAPACRRPATTDNAPPARQRSRLRLGERARNSCGTGAHYTRAGRREVRHRACGARRESRDYRGLSQIMVAMRPLPAPSRR